MAHEKAVAHEIVPGETAGHLAENIVYFARALRTAGIPLGPGSVLDTLSAVTSSHIGAREDFYWTLHAIFVKRHEQSILFDQAFRIFFRRRNHLERLMGMTPAPDAVAPDPASKALQRVQDALMQGLDEKLQRETQELEIDMRQTMSDHEILQKKDFAQMSAAEVDAAKRAIERLVLPLDEVRMRRLAPSRQGHVIDMRQTLRASMKGGGFIDLKYRRPKVRMPPVVALLDISGSMTEYTRLFLHFLHAVTEARKSVQSLLFGTRLTNVTRALKARDPDEAIATCTASVLDWSGGTRIATSLSEFNKKWARRLLTQGAIVLLITDGLERDTDDRLAFEIDRLHRSCRRLIWLNPLLRYEGFEARAKGIQAILPHVDEFRPIHNLESLEDLCRALSVAGNRTRSGRAWAAMARATKAA